MKSRNSLFQCQGWNTLVVVVTRTVKTERSRHSVMDIVTTLRVRIPIGAAVLFSRNCHDWRLGLSSLLSSGYRGFFFSGIKRPGPDVGHLPPSGVAVKNEWSCTAAPPTCYYGVGRNGKSKGGCLRVWIHIFLTVRFSAYDVCPCNMHEYRNLNIVYQI
jgi:hypothetical protein